MKAGIIDEVRLSRLRCYSLFRNIANGCTCIGKTELCASRK
jgi:hypothetical protein